MTVDMAVKMRRYIFPVLLWLLVLLMAALMLTPAAAMAGDGITDQERQLVQLVNQARYQAGAGDVQVDQMLCTLARLKVQDLAARGYVVSNSPTYGTMQQMLRQAQVPYTKAQEVLFKSPDAWRAHHALLQNSSYQKAVTNPDAQLLGVAVAKDNKGYDYVSLVLVQPGNAGHKQENSGTPASPDTKPNLEPKPEIKPETKQEPKPQVESKPDSDAAAIPQSASLTADEKQMLTLVNQERRSAGVAPLQSNEQLLTAARAKARDMIKHNYFSHTSPTYGSPFEMLKQFKISYSYAAENIAGAPQVNQAHASLMNSSGHRKNILSSNYTDVGIGIVDGGFYGKMYVQLFIRP